MASLDPIEIIIAAKDQATAVMAEVSAKIKAISAEMNALADEVAAKQSAMSSAMNDAAVAMGGGAAIAQDADAAAASHGNLADAVGESVGANTALAATERDVAAASSDAAAAIESKGKAAERASAATKDLKTAANDASPALHELGSQAGISSQFLGMGSMGLGTAAGLAAAIMGGVAVKSAGDFQAQLTKLVTSAGESSANLSMVGDGIKQIAVDTGTSTTQLTAAMYTIESGGQHGAAGLEVLKAAAQGAKAEGSDLATVADAVTSAMTDYHYSADQAATVTTKLVAATGAGKTTFEQLSAALPAILPKASAAGIALNEILGDLASMTMHGMSADQAAQNLAHSISSLQSPTQAMSKEMAALGLNSTQVSEQLGQKGLYGTLEEISTAIKKDMGPDAIKVVLNMEDALQGLPQSVQNVSQEIINGTASWTDWNKATKDLTVTQKAQAQAFESLFTGMHTIGTEQMSGAQVMQTYAGAMNKAVGTADGLNVALMLTGENSQNTTNAINAVSSATTEAGNNVKGWSDIQNNFNTKVAQFWQVINTSLISIGTQLLPVVTKAVEGLTGLLTGMMSAWKDLTPPAQTFFETVGVALLVGGPVLGGMSKLVGLVSKGVDAFTSLSSVAGSAFGLFKLAPVAEEAGTATAAIAGSSGLLSALGPLAVLFGLATVAGFGTYTVLDQLDKASKAQADRISSELSPAVQNYQALAGRLGVTLTDVGNSTSFLGIRQEAVANDTKMVSAATQQVNDLQKTHLSIQDQLKQKAGDVATAQDAVNKAYQTFGANSPQYESAVDNLKQKQQDYDSVLSDQINNNITLKLKTDDLTQAQGILKQDTQDLGNYQDYLNGKLGTGVNVVSQFGPTALAQVGSLQVLQNKISDVAASWAGTVNDIKVQSAISGQIIQGLGSNIDRLQGQSDVLNSKLGAATNSLSVIQNAGGGNIQGGSTSPRLQNALGTNFSPGGLTLVGENGPELVNMPTGSKVYNARETQQMVSGGNGTTVNIGSVTIANQMDEQKFLANLGWRLALR